MLKDAVIRTGLNSQLTDHQFRSATAKNHNDLLRRQTLYTTNRVPFIIQYFPGAEKLCHALRSLRHIDDYKHLAKIFLAPPLLTFKQPQNLRLLSLQDNIGHYITQPCRSNLCKTCQIIDMDPTITRGNTAHH
eukprot:g25834.t1